MHLKDFFPFSSFVISILSHAFPKYVCAIDFRYAACNSSVKCGRLGNIQYPFWVNGIQPTYCGHPWFRLDCQNDEAFWSEKQFRVLDMDNNTRTLKIARINDPSMGRIACPYYFNITKDLISIFRFTSDVTMIRVLHGCLLIKDLSSYAYPCNNQSQSYFVPNESLAKKYLSSCGYNFLLSVPRSAAEGLRNGSLGVGEALGKEYEVKWTANETQCEKCRKSGGRCGYDLNINTPSCFCRDKPHQQTCTSSTCNSSVECGRLGKIQYPFWVNGSQSKYCGHPSFELHCLKDEATMWIEPEPFHVISINNRKQTLKIARFDDPSTGNITCPYLNINKDSNTSFSYPSDVKMITVLYNCPQMKDLSSYECPCKINNNNTHSYFVANESLAKRFISRCGYSALLPVLRSAAEGLMNGSLKVGEALRKGFEIRWTTNETQCEECIESGGRSGYDWNSNTPSCFCRHKSDGQTCSSSMSSNVKMKITLGGVGMLLVGILIILSFKRRAFEHSFKRRTFEHRLMLRSHTNQNIVEFVRNFGSQAPKRYSYSDIKKMTNSFNDKIGQGGYGGVYKGKLGDGHLVAVKLLNTSKRNGEEFINEVASISRTSHVNIVNLLGFCFECGKKALIYEFMRNGSLENFLCSEIPLKASKHLGWEKLYQIAVGIARGLDYLHCGCRTKILQFDVKPHNILLDQDFTPKISDFGLAKLCPPKESIVSISVARGTIGYVAPEMFCRNFGRVSHKSDVYSYGMMILEIVGGRQKGNGTVDNTSETYFPHWIYKHLEQDEADLGVLEGVENKEENEVTRKMIVVGLWCIQTDPSHRPCMSKVIEMLEGSVEAL